MSKILRKTAKLFGSSAGPTQIGQFGSLAASAPAYSSDPAVIQNLSNWLGGWFSAVLGNNSPAIEDMNAMSFVFAYQLCYLMQEGVAEWDSGTTYYKGSIVNDGTGKLYISIYDGNLNHAVSATAYWLPYISGPYAPSMQIFTSGSGTYIPSFLFTVVAANATVGDTYTNNTFTFTVSQTISSGTVLVATGTGVPLSAGTLTKATGSGDSTISFVQVTRPLYIEVEMVGGGGGGGASGTGNTGNNTTFGTSLLVANGGVGGLGPNTGTGGAGGTASLGTGPLGVAIHGSQGGSSAASFTGSPSVYCAGGGGGSSPFGGAAGMALGSGSAAISNTGSGGAGGSAASTGSSNSAAGGGGSGGYIKALITNPGASYAYSVGSGGAGSTSSGIVNAGGAGASGIIIVKEIYQ